MQSTFLLYIRYSWLFDSLDVNLYTTIRYQPGENVFVPLHDMITAGSRNLTDMQISIGWSEPRAIVTGPNCPGGVKIIELFQAQGFWPPQLNNRWVPFVCASVRKAAAADQPLAIMDDDSQEMAIVPMPQVHPHTLPTAAQDSKRPRLALDGPREAKRVRVAAAATIGSASSSSGALFFCPFSTLAISNTWTRQ